MCNNATVTTITLYDSRNVIFFNKENSDEGRVCARVTSGGKKDVGPILMAELFISLSAATLPYNLTINVFLQSTSLGKQPHLMCDRNISLRPTSVDTPVLSPPHRGSHHARVDDEAPTSQVFLSVNNEYEISLSTLVLHRASDLNTDYVKEQPHNWRSWQEALNDLPMTNGFCSDLLPL